MNLDNLSNVGELVAATATVITLIFVAFELRANRRQNRLAMLTGLDKWRNDINAQMMQDDILPHLFFKGMSEPDSLTEEEASRFWILMKQLFDHHKSVGVTRKRIDTATARSAPMLSLTDGPRRSRSPLYEGEKYD